MGLGSFAGSLVNAGVNIWATNKNNKSAKHAAEMQRGWEKMMSDTAHQREVEDLQKAGLNPILSATGGSGASTPSGATAQTHAYNPIDIFSAALQMEKTQKEADGIQAGIDKTKAETAGINLENAKNKKLNPKIIEQAERNLEQTIAGTAKTNAETKKVEEETKRIQGGKLSEYGGTWLNDSKDEIEKALKQYKLSKNPKDLNTALRKMGLKFLPFNY